MRISDSEIRQPASGTHLQLRVPPDPRSGVGVRHDVLQFAAANGISPDDLTDFLTAIGEALANAMEHAHTSEPIDVSVWLLGEDRLFAAVQDHGVGFHPTERPIEASLPDAYAERGRGLPIMQRCADVFSVRSAPGQGTRITLGCYVSRQQAPLASARDRSLAG